MFQEIRDYRKIYHIRNILGVASNKRWMSCPLPQHRRSAGRVSTPSFSIYYDRDGVERWKCHGNCGLHGDVIDLVGYMNVPSYNPKDINDVLKATAILGNKHEITVQPVVRERNILDINAWKKYIPPGQPVVEYALARGLNMQTIEKFKIGQRKMYMAMPCFEKERLIGIKFRYVGEDDQLRFFVEKGGSAGLFNYDAVAWSHKKVLIVKGEIPAMMLDQYGLLACAPTAGEGSPAAEYAPMLGLSKKRIVIGDNDRDPKVREQMNKRARARANALLAELRFPPEEYKDVDEWILNDIFAIATIKEWLDG